MDQVLQSKTLNQENVVSFICFPLKTIPWPRFLYNRAQLHLKLSPHLLKAFTNPIKTGPSFKFVIKSKFKSTSWLQITLCSSNSYLFPSKGKKDVLIHADFFLLHWETWNNSINLSRLFYICTRIGVSRLSRAFVKTKVGSWVYSKVTIPKRNPCLSAEVKKMQNATAACRLPWVQGRTNISGYDHGTWSVSSWYHAKRQYPSFWTRLWQLPMLPASPPPSCHFCQHQPLYSDQGIRLKDCHLFPPVSTPCNQARLKAMTLTKRMVVEHTAGNTSKGGSTGIWI